MGTSASGTGPRPTTPLIPNWIPKLDDEEVPRRDDDPDDEDDDEQSENGAEGEETTPGSPPASLESSEISPLPNRYRSSRSHFKTFARDRSNNQQSLRDSLKQYIRDGSGGSRTFSRRMNPSGARVARFYTVANEIRVNGKEQTLVTFQLQSYSQRPLIDVLAALTDVIFDDSSSYHDIQDDSITKVAYVNTITRIDELGEIDLDHLTNDNIEVMMAIFIEETIVARVICDIGTKLYADLTDCNEALAIEETVYQIVSGYVRNDIMPEIVATQRSLVADLEGQMERIYRIAFDCIGGTE